MADPFGAGDSYKRKVDGVADAINRLLQNLVIKCAKSEEFCREFSGLDHRVGHLA